MTTKATKTLATTDAADEAAPDTFPIVLAQLSAPLDPNIIKQRDGYRDRNGNVHKLDYIEWHEVANILDRVAPRWSSTVKDIRVIHELLAVTVAITIDGVTREGLGTGTATSEMGVKKAESDALKRAAVKFGIARELYSKDEGAAYAPDGQYVEYDNGQQQQYNAPNGGGNAGGGQQSGGQGGGFTTPTSFPPDPIARSLGDVVTAKQLGMLRAVAREAGLDLDAESRRLLGAAAGEVTKRAASALIEHFKLVSSGGTGFAPIGAGGAPAYTGAPQQPQQTAPANGMSQQQLINASRTLAHNLGLVEGDVAYDASAGRAKDFNGLSVDELNELHETLKAM